MKENGEIIEIKFSDEYEKGLKRDRKTIPFIPLPAIILMILLGVSIEIFLILIPIGIAITLYALWMSLKGLGDLPKKIKIEENGVRTWKRNESEELIFWSKIDTINPMNSSNPREYFVFYKSDKFTMGGTRLFYHELALSNKAYHYVMASFNEYKARHGMN